MEAAALTITREDLDRILREAAERAIAERVAAMPLAELASKLDWQPEAWFAAQWQREPATVRALLRKLRVRISTLNQKTRLYSVPDANAKIAALGLVPHGRKRAKIISFAQPDLIAPAATEAQPLPPAAESGA